jgi:polysaccharide export outer membrane protein
MKFWPSVIAAVGAVSCILGACTLMPVAGPQSADIAAGQSDPQSIPYALVRLTARALDVLASEAPRIAGAFADRRGPESIRFGIGDILSVTIFEAGAGGLFTPAESTARTGNYVTLPSQAVDSMGNISVPYAGAIRAEGRTPVEVQRSIVDALKDQALQPQVVVSLVEQRASSFTVLGEVRLPGRFPVLASGERILDAIGRAGGLSAQGNESWVVLERGGRRATAPFGALIDQSENNIYVRAHDTVYVYREPQTFLAFGASGRQGQVPFDAWRVSLSEAVAKAAGLNDGAADPASVFVYRGETRHVAEQLGVNTSKFEGPIIPVIYNINLRDPAAYFIGSKFDVRNKDVVYVSNAMSVETSKFLNYIRVIVGTINDPIVAANGAYALKAAINGTSTGATIVSIPTAPAAAAAP